MSFTYEWSENLRYHSGNLECYQTKEHGSIHDCQPITRKEVISRNCCRSFLQASVGLTLGSWSTSLAGYLNASEKIVIGIVGVYGHGGDLLKGFLDIPKVEVAAVCDIDESILAQGVSIVAKARGTTPRAVADFHRIGYWTTNRSVQLSSELLIIGMQSRWY